MKLTYVTTFSMLVLSSHLMAQDLSIKGTITKNLKEPVSNQNDIRKHTKTQTTKKYPIKLLRIELSNKAKRDLEKRAQNTQTANNPFNTNRSSYSQLPANTQLGMSEVPVLNQGHHGSCVTFATTAAIDAVLKKGDYVSQLCQLQLGNYLEQNGYIMSGWDGSFGRTVLNQMETFGIVNKEQERAQGCGGLNQYPAEDDYTPKTSISAEDYHQLSEAISGLGIEWSSILDVSQAFDDRIDPNKTLHEVKKSLTQGDRVTFGVLLLDFDLGTMGAVGSKSSTNDSWVLTPEIARDVYLRPEFGGHEMVITGYDDDAIAVDDQGRKHQGLLTLRNSWGKQYGDKGDFYMSYDYFKLLVIEAHRIRESETGGDGEENRG